MCSRWAIAVYVCWMVVACPTESFLLDDVQRVDCSIIIPNCTCTDRTTLNCMSKGIVSIPIIDVKVLVNISKIDLSKNAISIVSDNAFSAFRNSSVQTLDLNNNNIKSIEAHAFVGVEYIIYLNLQNNQMTALPAAFGSLVNLQHLYIAGNALVALNPHVMAGLGRTLLTFSVDFGHFPAWPTEFRFLRHLRELSIDSIPFPRLDQNAFHGLENTLEVLILERSKLEAITSGICHLNTLKELKIQYNSALNETKHRIFEPCSGNLSKVSTLHLWNIENMLEFPILWQTFSSLWDIDIRYGPLTIMNPDRLPPMLTVTDCAIGSNKLVDIPYAINKFENLRYLFLYDNNIMYVDDNDLVHLTKLEFLYLQDNPLRYISNNAFQKNKQLRILDAHRTLLHTLPTDLTLLPNLETVNLSNTLIECTCDLSNLKSWNITGVRFGTAKCYQSDELIHNFMENDLQYC